jgi:hypothetical protein
LNRCRKTTVLSCNKCLINTAVEKMYHVRYLATLALGSSNSDQPFQVAIWLQNEGRHFGAKTSQTIWYSSTHFNSGSGFPDPDQLTCCTIYRCLFVEIQLLRNQISLCQHVFYYTGVSLSKSKYWHSNNCLHFLKCAVPFVVVCH